MVQINGQSEQKSAVAGQNGGHNRYIHYCVGVTCTTGRVQQIQNLNDKLRKVLNGELGTVEQHLGFVLLVLDVIHTKSLASKLRESEAPEHHFSLEVFIVDGRVELILVQLRILDHPLSLVQIQYLEDLIETGHFGDHNHDEGDETQDEVGAEFFL